MRKYGRKFLAYLNESLFLVNNRAENFEAIYLTVCLLIGGLFNENEFLVELVAFGFHVQELALLNFDQQAAQVLKTTSAAHANIHKFVCAYFSLLAKSSGVEALARYIHDVCEVRKRGALFAHLYPEYILLDESRGGKLHASSANNNNNNNNSDACESRFLSELATAAAAYYEAQFVPSSSQPPPPPLPPKQQQQQREEDDDEETETEAEAATTEEVKKESEEEEKKIEAKKEETNWLFDKSVVRKLLDEAQFATERLQARGDDSYSLSVSYLQQSQLRIQTLLKYRNPHSMSYESLSAAACAAAALNTSGQTLQSAAAAAGFGHSASQHNMKANASASGALSQLTSAISANAESGNHHGIGHRRGQSGAYNSSHNSNNINYNNSGGAAAAAAAAAGGAGNGGLVASQSKNQFVSTPRHSIDADSTLDDDTSYDSASQMSIDPNMNMDYLTLANAAVNNSDNNTNNNNPMHLLRQHYMQQQQQQQQNYTNMTSFETIKRVLFNGNGKGNGNVSGEGTPSSLSVLNQQQQQQQNSINSGLGMFLSAQLAKSTSDGSMPGAAAADIELAAGNDNEQLLQQENNGVRIINEFKQKPFDELRQSLQRSNQLKNNSEKYQQVLDLINKEISANSSANSSGTASHRDHHHHDRHHGGSALANSKTETMLLMQAAAAATSSGGGSLSVPLTSSSSSVAHSPSIGGGQSTIANNNNNYKDASQQKLVSLTDIEFPQIFMY